MGRVGLQQGHSAARRLGMDFIGPPPFVWIRATNTLRGRCPRTFVSMPRRGAQPLYGDWKPHKRQPSIYSCIWTHNYQSEYNPWLLAALAGLRPTFVPGPNDASHAQQWPPYKKKSVKSCHPTVANVPTKLISSLNGAIFWARSTLQWPLTLHWASARASMRHHGIVKGASVWRQRGALNAVWPQRHGPEHDGAQNPCEFDSALATDCFFGQVQVRVCFMRLTAGSAFFSTVWPHGCVRASLAATASPSSCLACTRHT